MAGDRWEHVFALFDAALARPEAERGAFLSRECGDDTRLRQEVQSLLEAHGGALEQSIERARIGSFGLIDSGDGARARGFDLRDPGRQRC